MTFRMMNGASGAADTVETDGRHTHTHTQTYSYKSKTHGRLSCEERVIKWRAIKC